ncbi:MAG TPA: arylsulfotransferase family protein [Gaiellaceae bacterium]|jgi:hypothetical protein
MEPPERLTRARFLRRSAAAGAGLALASAGGYGLDRLLAGNDARAARTGRHAWRFHTLPHLQPPRVTVLHRAEDTAPGRLFVAPTSGPGHHGVMIVDDAGDPIWFRKTEPRTATDFKVSIYRGKPVLTWWESLEGGGALGDGRHVIVDQHYRELARFPAGGGRPADLHELLLTPQGTALVTSFETRRADLRNVGHSKHGLVTGGVAQELEVPSARVLFEWRSLDHVPVTDAYNPVGYPWDYFHINAIDPIDDDHLLISGRNTWTAYKIHRPSGRIVWRLGGKRSDFALGKGARFAYQHDARWHDGGRLISVFDNGGAERTQVESQSRGLVLALDHRRRRATVAREYLHHPPVFGRVMGNVQFLPNGNAFVGWGADPHFTEFAPDGGVRFDATLPHGGESYRAFRFPWQGKPLEPPAVALVGRTLHVSWNGATDVAAWRLEAGASAERLRAARTQPKRGFETALELPAGARRASVVALDRHGNALGRSKLIAVR